MLSLSRICGASAKLPQFLALSSRNANRLTPLRSYANLICRRTQPLETNSFKAFQRGSGTISLRLASDSSQKGKKAVGYWLLTCSGMVFVAVVLGISFYYGILKSIYKVMEEIVKKTKGS